MAFQLEELEKALTRELDYSELDYFTCETHLHVWKTRPQIDIVRDKILPLMQQARKYAERNNLASGGIPLIRNIDDRIMNIEIYLAGQPSDFAPPYDSLGAFSHVPLEDAARLIAQGSEG